MMREMQKMQFEDLTELNLVERDAGFMLSGQSKNAGLEGLGVLENLQLIQDLQRPCLLLILIHIILGRFDPYGKILNIRIRRNFAFIQFETQEDATKALDATNLSKLMERVISVEYAIKDDDERRNGHSPDRGRDRSLGRRRSPSPYRRERASPDYGRGHSPSPRRRERASPDYGRGRSLSPSRRERERERERVNSDYGRGPSPSPSPRRERPSPDQGHGPSPREKASPDYCRGPSSSPRRERVSPEDYRRGPSPNSKPALRDSPKYGGAESPMDERYRSRSPLVRERSRS
uniref:RRM domain-containing protein n=1 Tax=Davidia involucrata TaxID=16924 RepID=A0A5B6ZS79_DAVIN